MEANTALSGIFREYLRENEFLCKTILACLSGAQMASYKKNGKKSRDTVPLMYYNFAKVPVSQTSGHCLIKFIVF